mgnify:FL=1
MNSPIIILFHNKICRELIDIIQSYVRNDIAHQAIKNHIRYLYYEQDLYDSFVWDNYIAPNCYCRIYRRGNKDCEHCHLYEYTNHYKLSRFITCIEKNSQYNKLITT